VLGEPPRRERAAAAGEGREDASGVFSGLHSGKAGAKMPFVSPIRSYDSAEQLEAYYKSPERAAYGEHIGSHIAKTEVREVEGVVGQVPVANM
jgi:hypothetical protein